MMQYRYGHQDVTKVVCFYSEANVVTNPVRNHISLRAPLDRTLESRAVDIMFTVQYSLMRAVAGGQMADSQA